MNLHLRICNLNAVKSYLEQKLFMSLEHKLFGTKVVENKSCLEQKFFIT